MEHDLKSQPPWFDDVLSGDKTFEVRINDRGYQVGDVLHLREWSGGQYSGRSCFRRVSYVLAGGQFGLDPAYCVLGLDMEAEGR